MCIRDSRVGTGARDVEPRRQETALAVCQEQHRGTCQETLDGDDLGPAVAIEVGDGEVPGRGVDGPALRDRETARTVSPYSLGVPATSFRSTHTPLPLMQP